MHYFIVSQQKMHQNFIYPSLSPSYVYDLSNISVNITIYSKYIIYFYGTVSMSE